MQYQQPHKFEPSRRAALHALAKVDPALYSRTRNFLDGAVTCLSPWITHGYLSVREATQVLMEKYRLSFEDKLIFEFAWREFFKHAHAELGNGIFSDVRRPVWPGKYSQQLPDDIREGRTGIQAIDAGVAMLYETGYLHNHVRMWIASYVVHMRKVHWKVGADWMYAHLLDGDLASNHLSWQWVAGTFSHKPYVFNSDNVKKYAPRWDCSGTAIDTDYEDLESIARGKREVGREKRAPAVGVKEPIRHGFDLELLSDDLKRKTVDLRLQTGLEACSALISSLNKIILVHPWDLKACFELTQSSEIRVGLIDCAFHKAHPWNKHRWDFVLNAMETGCDQIWILNTDDIGHCSNMLSRFIQTDAKFELKETLNTGYATLAQCFPIRWIQEEKLLPNPPRFQQSFSRFYREATMMAGSLEEAIHGGLLVD